MSAFGRIIVFALCLLQTGVGLAATDVFPLRADQVPAILGAYSGKPLVVEIWSLDCSYCRENLGRIAQWRKDYPDLEVIMVCIDAIADADQLSAVLARMNAEGIPQYVNAEPIPEKLQAALDPDWHGETPRTLFINGKGKRSAISGLLHEDSFARMLGERP